MIPCPECQTPQYQGAIFCSECGANLLPQSHKNTAVLPFVEDIPPLAPPSLLGKPLDPSPSLHNITFVIPSSGRRVIIREVVEVEIGRKDLIKGLDPALDLSPDNGAKQGVSRLHAIIKFTQLGPTLTDLNSTNGTLLNNYRLPPKTPYLLHNGDEIRFGHLLTHIFWE